MATPTTIKIADLDYDEILTNIVTFMKSDPAFSDYDFSGSGLRMISRVLAYVTFYINYYTSMAVNESFIDTAKLRSSVVSHAKMLGYQMHGLVSATVDVPLSVATSNTTMESITLPRGTKFAHMANSGMSFVLLTDTDITQNTSTLTYDTDSIVLTEGRLVRYQFDAVDSLDASQIFVIPSANIDYASIKVYVYASNTDSTVTLFNPATNYISPGPNDAVFFTKETSNSCVELEFGNGVVGKALADGNIVIAEYLVSSGVTGNGIKGPFTITSTTLDGFVSGTTTITVDTMSSNGGSNKETIEEGRALAPLVYQAQDRCVTASDYKSILLQHYGTHIDAINVFGGEMGDPSDPSSRPVYGKVFIAIKPTEGLQFTESTKKYLTQSVLAPRIMVGVVPEIINPDYTYLVISSLVSYDPHLTNLTRPQLQEQIKVNVSDYVYSHTGEFDTIFRTSRINRTIDDTDTSIIGSTVRVDLEKRVYPVLNEVNSLTLNYGTPFLKVSGTSALLEPTQYRFSHMGDNSVTYDQCFFYEANNVLHIAHRNTNNVIEVIHSSVGQVDANIGVISISQFSPIAIENDGIFIGLRVRSSLPDITSSLNRLFVVDGNTTTTTMVTTSSNLEQQRFLNAGVVQ